MTNAFLKQVVLDCLSAHDFDAPNSLFIFPSHRALQAFLRIWITVSPRAAVLPRTATLNEWLDKVSEKTTADKLKQLQYLMEAAQSLEGRDALMSRMHAWFDVFIGDSAALSAAGIPIEKAWKEIAVHHATGSFSDEHETRFWQHIPALAREWQQRMETEGRTTAQGQFTTVAQSLNSGDLPLPVNTSVHWVGFAILNRVEQDFLLSLRKQYSVYFHLDMPALTSWYKPLEQLFQSTLNACGDSLKLYPCAGIPKIRYLELPRNAGHRHLLSMGDTAATATPVAALQILINESNLPAYLATPHAAAFANISTALHARSHFVGEWIYSALRCPSNRLRDELRALTFWAGCNGEDLPEVHTDLLPDSTERLEFIFKCLSAVPGKRVPDVFLEAVHTALGLVNKCHAASGWASAFLKLVIQNVQFNRPGSQDDELQWMGLLESRALDHEKVNIVDAGDDLLPGKAGGDTFIPFALRRHWQLPDTESRNALIAYYFLRLLGRAQDVNISYTPQHSSVTEGGPSRFLYLLSYRAGTASIATLKPSLSKPVPLNFHLPVRLADLDYYFKHNGLSASAINCWYRDNAEAFYLRYVLKITEPRTVRTNLNADIGTLFHRLCQQLYTPFIDQWLNTQSLQEAKRNLQTLTRDVFMELPDFGKDRSEAAIYIKLLENWAGALLLYDIKRLEDGQQIRILGLEKKVETRIKHPRTEVLFKGDMDRLEQCDKEWFICDYKSGKGFEDKEIKDFNSFFTNKENHIRRQMLLYRWLMQKNGRLAIPALFSVFDTQKGFQKMTIPPDDMQNTEQALLSFIDGVYAWADDYCSLSI